MAPEPAWPLCVDGHVRVVLVARSSRSFDSSQRLGEAQTSKFGGKKSTRLVNFQFGGKKSAIEIDSSIWRLTMLWLLRTRNELLICGEWRVGTDYDIVKSLKQLL